MNETKISPQIKRITFTTREEWLSGRKNHIGGSDSSSIIGMNPYKSNVELWEEKMGIRVPEDISHKEYVIYGNEAEEPLRELFLLDYPEYKLVYDDNNMYINKAYPFAHASLDGELIDKDGRHGILEIKTTNILQSMQREKWNDRLPDNYYIQILHYLMVTGFDFVVLKAQLKSKWKDEIKISIKHYFIERKDALEDIEYLVVAERKFWDSIVTKKRPNLILPPL